MAPSDDESLTDLYKATLLSSTSMDSADNIIEDIVHRIVDEVHFCQLLQSRL